MTKAAIYILLFIITLCSCNRPMPTAEGSDDGDTLAIIPSHYNDDLYNQGRTEGCWIYAMLACIETEQLRRGDSITLSRQWLMARVLEEQVGKWKVENGKRNISLRGVGKDVLRLIGQYGLVPYAMEKSRINNSRVLQRKLMLLSDNNTLTDKQRHERVMELLPQFTVARPSNSFYYYSMRYTPQQFAESVVHWQLWRFYASDERHPWHEPFVLDVPDNRQHHKFLNLPPQELLSLVMQSLQKGHPVYWEQSKKADTGASDHAMAIVGLRHGKDGKPRFLCLNSYGKKWGNNGYCLVSPSYFLRHLCNVGVLY